MTNLSKQDVQAVVDNAKNQVLQRVATRQDIQVLFDIVKTNQTIGQQNQQLLRQSEYQRIQSARRVAALEARMAQLDQEIRNLRSSLETAIARLADHQPEHIIMPVEAENLSAAQKRFLYNPN